MSTYLKGHWGALTAAALGIGVGISMWTLGQPELGNLFGFAGLLQLEPLVAGS